MIFDFIINLAIDFFSLFPRNPFGQVNNFLHNQFFVMFWGYLNYFVPWDWIKICFDGWAACIITYFIIKKVSHK